jgi:hypothetical protein
MRYFVAAQSDDLPPARMRDELLAAGVDCDGVDRAVGSLQRDPALLEAAALAVLQAGWDDPVRRELAAGALGAAGAKLPVVEVALISIVAVYGLWLTATKGRRSHEHIVRRWPRRQLGGEREDRLVRPVGPARSNRRHHRPTALPRHDRRASRQPTAVVAASARRDLTAVAGYRP